MISTFPLKSDLVKRKPWQFQTGDQVLLEDGSAIDVASIQKAGRELWTVFLAGPLGKKFPQGVAFPTSAVFTVRPRLYNHYKPMKSNQ